MATISCSSNRCIKNKHGYCGSNSIEILGENAHSTRETVCSTYEYGNVFRNVVSASGIFSANNSVGETEIKCNAHNCFYNSYGSCNAKNLQFKDNEVNGGGSCDTFIEAY